MGNKKTLIIVSVLFVALMVGASLLYSKLGTHLTPDHLLIPNDGGSNVSDNVTPGNSAGNNMSDTDIHSDENNESSGSDTNESTDENTTFPAPDFTVYDRAGNTVRLSDFLGKPVVLNFWASWCGPCKMEMPDFEEIYKEYKEELHFIMVNLTDGSRETMDTATTFLDRSGYTFPVYYDKDSDAAYTYQVYGIPVTYFINAEGNLIAQGSSALDAETIKRGIGMILD